MSPALPEVKLGGPVVGQIGEIRPESRCGVAPFAAAVILQGGLPLAPVLGHAIALGRFAGAVQLVIADPPAALRQAQGAQRPQLEPLGCGQAIDHRLAHQDSGAVTEVQLRQTVGHFRRGTQGQRCDAVFGADPGLDPAPGVDPESRGQFGIAVALKLPGRQQLSG